MPELQSKLHELKIDRAEPAAGPRRRGPWITAAVVVLALLALAGWWLLKPRPIPVETAVAREAVAGSSGQTVLNANGYVTARRQATVSSKVTGKVVEVSIEEGMAVTEGQILARLDDTNQRAATRLADAELGAARAALEETRVRLDEARLDLERARKLAAAEVASPQDVDRATAAADALAARLASQRETVRVAERALALQRQVLDDLLIRAPFDGIVVTKNAQPGEMISPISAGGGFTRTGIGTLVDMGSLEIEVDVNEAYIHRVRPEQRVEARLDAYPDWPIPASVLAIIPTADRQRATVQVRIAFDELDPRILPDMGVKVAFQGAVAESGGPPGVKVPRQAMAERDGRDVVFVVDDGAVERRAVSAGEADGAEVLVVSGLAAGEHVVLDPPADLADGTRVKEASE